MFAKKIIIETDKKGNIKKPPVLTANKKYEAIFLTIDEIEEKPGVERKPHSEIAGKIKIYEDIIDTLSKKHWDLPE